MERGGYLIGVRFKPYLRCPLVMQVKCKMGYTFI